MATWQAMIRGAKVTQPRNLQEFLIRLVRSAGLDSRELAGRADMSVEHAQRMLAGRSGGSLEAWQRLLDAAEVTLPAVADHATRR